jgi:hypothetical protein
MLTIHVTFLENPLRLCVAIAFAVPGTQSPTRSASPGHVPGDGPRHHRGAPPNAR